jgi:membrane fusion protein (multidrug efflux system)
VVTGNPHLIDSWLPERAERPMRTRRPERSERPMGSARPERPEPLDTGRLLRLVILLGILSLPLALAACQNGDAREEGQSGGPADSLATATAAADSLAPPDSSAVSGQGGQKKSWKDRLFGGGHDEKEKKDLPVPVEMADAALRDMPAFLTSTATLEPEKQADMLAKIAGEVRGIYVEEGDWVQKDQLLAELDGAAQRVALEEVAAEARGLELNLDRIRALHEQDLASDKDLNNAEAEFAQAQARQKAMELDLSYTRITAPFAGQISHRSIDPGQTVSVGAPLFTILDADPLLARIYLPEREVARLEPGQEVLIHPDTADSVDLEGSVLRIAPIVDSRTGTVKVTCQVEGHADVLRPGSFVRVQVQTGLHESVLAIPKRALVPEGGETMVFKAEADSVIKVRVETGYTDDRFVEVVDGLEEGDRIVTVGQGALKVGAKFRDLSAEAASASPGAADSTARAETLLP